MQNDQSHAEPHETPRVASTTDFNKALEFHDRTQDGLAAVKPLDPSEISSFNLKFLAC